ncbi:AAA family ATPase [Chryseobacterium sp. MHB01]|uniref:AAA family ATPase n=1 Tax=Chryseobacterium sp. MHB01 TaxID=3109433 RepID=UPI002B000A4B|nr:AAA family ATPase [Chryseobacterium sp. MHB01]MEA1848160.1 AAA family ATPase [Chryseobacterium sp. MHB01]
MKIKKIRIQNFKVFQNTIIDFETSDLIVFDGPNGFGKTSIYDAIELLFTGKIRRFDDLKSRLIDGRESFSEHPFLCDYADGDISITIEFSKEDSTYILQRIAKREELTNSVNFSLYKLYEKTDFELEEGALIENEEEYLNQVLGHNYKQNFQFLNYIEQEDSLFLLKNQDKHRKQHISHLFNVEEFENRIFKIDKLKNKVSELCNSEKKYEIDTLKESIQKIETILANEFDNTEYIKLFTDKDIPWDLQEFNYQGFTYENLFNEEGVISKLKKLVVNKEQFEKYIQNEKIDKLIREKEKTENFLLYYYFLPNKESLQNQKKEFHNINETIAFLEEFSREDFKENVFELENFDFLEEDLIFDFEEGYSSLEKSYNELDELENVYSKIEESRNKLISNIKRLKDEEKIKLDGTCFLCGYDWSNINELLENIEIQSLALEEITSAKSKIFNDELTKFKEEVILVIIETLNQKIQDDNFDINFVNQFLSMEESFFYAIKKDFESVGFNYNEYLNETSASDSSVDIDNTVIPELSSLKFEIDLGNIETYFKELFSQYFDNNLNLLKASQIENILLKEKYLKYKYSILQNETLERNKQELNNKESKFDNAKQLENNLKHLNNIYKKSLNDYQSKVIEDIEIIFHIYSGRIMQDFQGGLGLFIYSNRSVIRFQTNPSKTFDAVFSMSSGQLSALIISFTLALHKKYSQNKIILIDDPVQTMDEINLVGFIELLRNEFYSNQLVISTHEDMASAFIRYKFKNYGLTQKRINLKMHQN